MSSITITDLPGTETNTESDFDFKKLCFYCCEDAAELFEKIEVKKAQHKRTLVYRVQRLGTQENVVRRAINCNTAFSKQLLQRIQNVDLIAAGARYHATCGLAYFRMLKSSEKKCVVKGRPPNSNAKYDEMVAICKRFPEQCFTIQSLSDAVDCEHNIGTVKAHLNQMNLFMIFGSIGSPTAVVLNEQVDRVLLKKWKESKQKKEVYGERVQIVHNAASGILEDVKEIIGNSLIPPSEMFLESDIPPSLRVFLSCLMKSSRYSTDLLSVAHTIFTAIQQLVQSKSKSLDPSENEYANCVNDMENLFDF